MFKIIIGVAIFFLSGCATIMHGDSQYVEINSVPSGATAHIEGNYFITPAKILLKRGYPLHKYQILVQNEVLSQVMLRYHKNSPLGFGEILSGA